MSATKPKLTSAQRRVLEHAARQGSVYPFGSVGSGAGGSIRRMVERMAKAGLFERRAPFAITDAGRAVLASKSKQPVSHSPGPWKLVWREPPFVEHAGWIVKMDDEVQFPICIVNRTCGLRSPQEANARLIVASPEGYALAKRFLEIAADVTNKGPRAKPTVAQLNELFDLAQANVRKVEGR